MLYSIIIYKIMRKVKNPQLSEIRKRVLTLTRERSKTIFSLLQGQPLINGSAYDVYKKCGKKNCKCTNGELHGPYPALSVCKNGKQRIVMIRKEDQKEIITLSCRHVKSRRMLAKVRRINKQIDILLEKIREETTQEYR